MTPAERLIAAADLLDKRASDDLTPGPWEVRFQCPEGSHHHDWDEVWIAGMGGSTVAGFNERYTCAPRDAAYVATVHPEVGKALAKCLRSMAADFEHDVIYDVTYVMDIADLLLAGAS